jgi:hypothetical protein
MHIYISPTRYSLLSFHGHGSVSQEYRSEHNIDPTRPAPAYHHYELTALHCRWWFTVNRRTCAYVLVEKFMDASRVISIVVILINWRTRCPQALCLQLSLDVLGDFWDHSLRNFRLALSLSNTRDYCGREIEIMSRWFVLSDFATPLRCNETSALLCGMLYCATLTLIVTREYTDASNNVFLSAQFLSIRTFASSFCLPIGC